MEQNPLITDSILGNHRGLLAYFLCEYYIVCRSAFQASRESFLKAYFQQCKLLFTVVSCCKNEIRLYTLSEVDVGKEVVLQNSL